jgi:hypothetical protein
MGLLIVGVLVQNPGMEIQKVENLGPSLLEAFKGVPDPRKPRGRRHPLPAILTLATWPCAAPM